MTRAAQLQPPLARPEVRATKVDDAKRWQRIGELLQDVLDNARTPGKDARP